MHTHTEKLREIFVSPQWRLVAPLQQHSHITTEYADRDPEYTDLNPEHADMDPVIPELSKTDVQSNICTDL